MTKKTTKVKSDNLELTKPIRVTLLVSSVHERVAVIKAAIFGKLTINATPILNDIFRKMK